MTIHVNRITIAAPVLNPIILGAGGSLVVGVTYYYRLIALRVYAGRYALSVASAEQAVTPTTGNQTAQLSWPAVTNATAYIIQRTTTPGNYPVEGANTLNLNGQSYAGYPYATTLTSLNDDGGATTNIRFNSGNLDFATEHAMIEVYADAVSEVVTLWDIANALAGGGFADLQIIGSPGLQAGTNYRDQGPYTLRGHLYIRDCTYRQRGALIGFPGCLYIKSNSVIIQIGDPTTTYAPILLHLGMPRIPYTSNNNTFSGIYSAGTTITGKSGEINKVSMFIERHLVRGTLGGYSSINNSRYSNLGDYRYCDVINSILGLSSGDSFFFYSYPTTNNNLLESCVPAGPGPLVDTTIRYGNALYMDSANNVIVQRCITKDMNYDMRPWSSTQKGNSFIDHTFAGRGQTDNQPYLTITKIATEITTTILSVTRNFLILDSDGEPLENAVITALNAQGLSAFWEDSLATFSTALDAATDPASLTVSDGTKFSAGDYIRCETYGECLKVTAINGNVLTVARAQLGTFMRKHVTGNNNRVLKMLASVTTDANGRVNCVEPTLQRELYSVSGSGSQVDYEDTLITNGYLGRTFFGPYNLQIAKEGYQTYTYPLLDPDLEKYPLGPGTLEVEMIPFPPPVYVNVPSGEVDITLAAPRLLEVTLEAAEIMVEMSDG